MFGCIDVDNIAVKYLNVTGTISVFLNYASTGTNTNAGITDILKSGTIENCNFEGIVLQAQPRTSKAGGIAG